MTHIKLLIKVQNRDENPDVLSDKAQGQERSETPAALSSTFQIDENVDDNQNESSNSQSLFPSIQSWMHSSESGQNFWNPFRNQWAQRSVLGSLIPRRSNQSSNQSVHESLIPSRRSNLCSNQRSTELSYWNHGISERPVQGTLDRTEYYMHPITESQRLRNLEVQRAPPTLPSMAGYLAELAARRDRHIEGPESVPSLESAPPNDPGFSRISELDTSKSYAINPTLPSFSGAKTSDMTKTDTLSVQEQSNPWHLSSSIPNSPHHLKTSTQRARLGQQLLGLDSDSDSSPIIKRRSSIILAQDSQSQDNQTQIISDSD